MPANVMYEGRHAGEFLVSEANGTLSREAIIVTGAVALVAGAVLGRITVGGASAAAVGGNTGNGVLTLATPPTGPGARSGVYTITCTEEAENGGVFAVAGPDGGVIGTATVGVAFDGPVRFTIADGATDFDEGDAFTITLAPAQGTWKRLNPAGNDGSDEAAGILWAAVDATEADARGVAIARNAEVNAAELTWPNGITGNQKLAAIADLAARDIILR